MTARWSCEACDADVSPTDAHTETRPGYDGPVTLVFCPGCTA